MTPWRCGPKPGGWTLVASGIDSVPYHEVAGRELRNAMAGGLTLNSQRLGRGFFTQFDGNRARLRLREVLDYPFFGMLLAGG